MQCQVYRGEDPRWDRFVLSRPDGTFFHMSGWRDVLEQSFGYDPFYLYVQDRGEIVGVLPLSLVKSLLFGRSLVAAPLGVYGGVLAESEKVARLLFENAVAIARENRARYLELRGNPYSTIDPAAIVGARHPIRARDLYVTFLSEIDPSPDVNMSRVPRKQRRMIRQGQKCGLRAVFDNSRLREFYRVYAASVRNLGTPVYGYGYFERLLQSFGESCRVLVIEHENKVVAGVLVFLFKDQILPYYGGALKEYFHLAPNDFMYWQVMCYGAANGYRTFDFGRSKRGTGSYDFKRHWGFEPRPLTYWYHPLNGHEIPDTSPLNPKLQWAIRVWRNLPLGITTALGPHIVRHIP